MTARTATTRTNVVLLCFECRPGSGSEAGVGWMWARAAAQWADVTVLTDQWCVASVREAAAREGLPITVVGVGLRGRARRCFPSKLCFAYYLLWQALAARTVRALEHDGAVDVVHHLTWASDSLPSALLASRAPVRVWGPVGGSTRTAWGLYQYLTPRGRLDQHVRQVVNGSLRAVFGRRLARHATLVVALNDEVADHFRSDTRPVLVEPNLALDAAELDAAELDAVRPATAGPEEVIDLTEPALRTAVFVGRLIPWKGLLLAVRALAFAPHWQLLVLGAGPDRARAERLADELGVTGRISFAGQVTRPQALATLAASDALLLPSFHDSAPWAAGEAAALGCHVVCLDAGGPALLAGRNGHPVHILDGATLPERIGTELEHLGDQPEPDPRWSAERLPELLRLWYAHHSWGAHPQAATEHQEVA